MHPKLLGRVDDSNNASIELIDKFNNFRLLPIINSLVQKDYFRYFKVNMKKVCQFWANDARCSLKDCHIQVCNDVRSCFLLNLVTSICFNIL
jgi:hypothetical protein